MGRALAVLLAGLAVPGAVARGGRAVGERPGGQRERQHAGQSGQI
jgi:hypothetical protein